MFHLQSTYIVLGLTKVCQYMLMKGKDCSNDQGQ